MLSRKYFVTFGTKCSLFFIFSRDQLGLVLEPASVPRRRRRSLSHGIHLTSSSTVATGNLRRENERNSCLMCNFHPKKELEMESESTLCSFEEEAKLTVLCLQQALNGGQENEYEGKSSPGKLSKTRKLSL